VNVPLPATIRPVRYAAFLRAVNLGRNRRVSGADLKRMFEEAGAEDVSTFRTSGNVVFEAPRDMTRKLETHLEAELGHEMVIFMRTERELKSIAAHEPFPAREVDASKGKLQVLLLGPKLPAAARKKVLALATDEDRLAFGDRELFWLPSGGTQGSSLDQNALGKLLGKATQRTMGTIEQLAAKFFVAALIAVCAAAAGLAAPTAASAAPPAAEPSAHPKRCGLIARGSRDYRVRARVVTCRFAVKWSRAYFRRGARPRGYSCSRPGGSFPFFCRKGRRQYWAERLGASARAAHPGHGPSQVVVGGGAFFPNVVRVATDDTVLWFWNGPDLNHTVTSDPGQAESFDSDPTGVPVHPRNDVHSHRFTHVGRFTYFCRIHPTTMRGAVEVVEPPAVDETRPRLSRVRANGATRRLRFRVSERATVLARIERPRRGRWRAVRSFDLTAKRGRNRARMPLRGLAPGRYRARLVAYDRADNGSRPAFARFRL